MVARINTGKNISKTLNYNEQKVKEGKAEILSSSGFVKEFQQMNFYDKLNHFQRTVALNERVTTNTVHISLNFDPSENIAGDRLIEIANVYMQKIGFGNQPYLVYRHFDAGHPHIHIVSTNIQLDGKRISMHNLGRNESESARRQIEIDFNLVKADTRKILYSPIVIPVNVQKVRYGKSETKRAITNVLMHVVNQYLYSSLAELNAVLKLYNVVAETGSRNSKMYKGKGLVYRVLDSQGNKIGTPIKASAFYMRPTLLNLENKFQENQDSKMVFKSRIRTSIDWAFSKRPQDLTAFIKALEKENINTVLRIGKEGVFYGITYVDHRTKSVFNGSEIGKLYSAKAIQEKFTSSKIEKAVVAERQKADFQEPEWSGPVKTEKCKQDKMKTGDSTTSITIVKMPPDYIPKELKKRKRKKRKKISI